MNPGNDYVPVPIDAAREIAERFGKQVVVVLAWERESGRFHRTTYGQSADDKIAAARLGEVCAEAAGFDPRAGEVNEDFRLRTAAEWAVEREQLLARIRQLEAGCDCD